MPRFGPSRFAGFPSFRRGSNSGFLLLVLSALTVGSAGRAWADIPFVVETVATPANGVSPYTSIAVDSQGNPHISFQEAVALDLKYAHKSGGAWIIETVDGVGTDAGRGSSIAVDADDRPHISYMDVTGGSLEYAVKTGGVWTIEVVRTDELAESETSLALDAQGNPHIAYSLGFVNKLPEWEWRLWYSRKSAGSWSTAPVQGFVFDPPSVSIARDGVGKTHLTYTWVGQAPRYCLLDQSGWGPCDDFPPGHYPDGLAADDVGIAHVSFVDKSAAGADLGYGVGNFPFAFETVDGSADDVGSPSSLALDALGRPHVSYYDASNGDLLYARKTGGAWFVQIADGAADDVGDWNSLALDAAGNPHVSYVNATQGSLRYAKGDVLTGVGPPTREGVFLTGSPSPTRDGRVTFSWRSRSGGPAALTIFDSSGRRVAALRGEADAAVGLEGTRGSVVWQGKNDLGRPVSGGTYFARLEAGGLSRIARITVLR